MIQGGEEHLQCTCGEFVAAGHGKETIRVQGVEADVDTGDAGRLQNAAA